ncbi:hypothetical protein INT43_003391 [Umbelopsis isabellina]|uniref:Uncharacterized protein n=1 Tax=Mortierella isabellina TaxID=91625 RepID=A0A8H7PQP4_MORIS|nr:hypothetical protein INT43_003391 [Umbelopsis isabellina]
MLAVGIAFAFVGNAVIGLGNVIQKYALARVTKPPERPGLHLPKSVDETQTLVQGLKLAMARRVDTLLRSGYAGDPTKSYSRFRDRLWWTGFLATYAGEVGGNWVALSVASPTVVTPLGIVGVIANIIFANLLLGEQVSKRHSVGYCWIIGGVFFLLWASLSGEKDAITFEDVMAEEGVAGLTNFIFSTRVLTIAAVLAVAITLLVRQLRRSNDDDHSTARAKKRRSIIISSTEEDISEATNGSHSNPTASRRSHINEIDMSKPSVYQPSNSSQESSYLVLGIHVFLCSILGGITVVTSKIAVTFLRCWLADESQPASSSIPLLLFLVCLLVCSIAAQETVKQLTLQKFSLAVFQPVFYALYVTNVTILSLALFEMQAYQVWSLIRIAFGILLIAKGVGTILDQDSFGIRKRVAYFTRAGVKAITSLSLVRRAFQGRMAHNRHHEEANSGDSMELK